jgi:two-component system copper resistance phosphate regulon response regulator CusR/two-component system response regulator QseB
MMIPWEFSRRPGTRCASEAEAAKSHHRQVTLIRCERRLKLSSAGIPLANQRPLSTLEMVSAIIVKILIVEDQKRLGLFLKKGLSERAYTASWVQSCHEARDALCESSYDAIILDLTLPDGDGLELLQEWRKGGFNEPVLILSARDAVQDRIRGLDLGADDYLAKPFSFEELIARVRSLMRRQSVTKGSVLERGDLRMDLLSRNVTQGGKPVELTSREFALLEFFLQNPGRILPRTLICEKIWESHYDIDTNLLDVYMSKLRSKLESNPDKPVFKTVRGVGYQLL